MVILALVWVAIVVLALVFVGLLLLAVPVELTFRAATGDGTRSGVGVRWLFGLVRRDVGASEKEPPVEPEEEEEPEPQDSKKRHGPGAFVEMTQSGALFRLIGLGRRLIRKIELREFVLRGRFGTGDPGQTGIIYGVSSAITGSVNRRRNVDIQLTPSYTEAVLDGEVYGTLRLVPIRLLPPLIGFIIRPSNIRALRQLRKGAA